MILDKLIAAGVVAVVRGKNHKEIKDYMEACLRGGLKALELTYTIPNVVELIKEYKDREEALIGVGSVLNGKMALDAIEAGAKYVVSPGYNEEVNKVCKEKEILYLPGCMTVTEIMHAMEAGNSMIKLFPGELFGPKFVKAIKAPIPHVKIMPTGGVSIDNVEEWFANGVSCVGVGSALFKGTIEDTEKLAKEFVNKIEKVRS
ncbi:bifunctional 4-hydroxy-2-oxoglutarate aldolase/2-dehydro-3-deoxy-phosphogluconate aldolase [Clostridium isatidis]|uniref:2-dehydro-3-deoxyphosphogluconate aldolase n=1 Tax=Clostridium isatidis TaxID=182773 RepID=A0A343JDI1_9CLOT|nr:bifunctional 4-hydroxy-2-oxoglutarate aldolase/2-dehydro-3-deoxy-phosphogluconate aldolase [Clostridium isatidis]ASW43589.1 2-dehydro-3-deoxyphosphogluconate aldolase [Clostridium isatidis]NLZ34693.1 bifunctional 4-hydroxy-2-oxoglutarate aldolase/2-dehydro-3-deoxy-phosphogluconate aldolase [Clostridiales bacterium]